jgi:hypothetical protein
MPPLQQQLHGEFRDRLLVLCSKARSFEDIFAISKNTWKDFIANDQDILNSLCVNLIKVIDTSDPRAPPPNLDQAAHSLKVILREIPTVACNVLVVNSVLSKPFSMQIGYLVECLELCYSGTEGIQIFNYFLHKLMLLSSVQKAVLLQNESLIKVIEGCICRALRHTPPTKGSLEAFIVNCDKALLLGREDMISFEALKGEISFVLQSFPAQDSMHLACCAEQLNIRPKLLEIAQKEAKQQVLYLCQTAEGRVQALGLVLEVMHEAYGSHSPFCAEVFAKITEFLPDLNASSSTELLRILLHDVELWKLFFQLGARCAAVGLAVLGGMTILLLLIIY